MSSFCYLCSIFLLFGCWASWTNHLMLSSFSSHSHLFVLLLYFLWDPSQLDFLKLLSFFILWLKIWSPFLSSVFLFITACPFFFIDTISSLNLRIFMTHFYWNFFSLQIFLLLINYVSPVLVSLSILHLFLVSLAIFTCLLLFKMVGIKCLF